MWARKATTSVDGATQLTRRPSGERTVHVDLDLIIGFLISWVTRKAARLGSRVDTKVDEAMDAGLDHLHDVVTGKLGDDPALRTLEQEATGGDVSGRTRQRVRLALEEAVDTDPVFANALASATGRLNGTNSQVVEGVATQGDVHVHAEDGSIAAQVINGGATVHQDPSRPAR